MFLQKHIKYQMLFNLLTLNMTGSYKVMSLVDNYQRDQKDRYPAFVGHGLSSVPQRAATEVVNKGMLS